MVLIRQFFANRRGVIATEFALVAPIMIFLWIALVELATAYLITQKVELAAQSAADIIAQDDFTDIAKLENIDSAVKTILFPYDMTKMGYRIASIVANSEGANSVEWAQPGGGVVVPIPDPTIGDSLTTAGDSVIIVTVTYNHSPVFISQIIGEQLLGASIALSETAFAKPRLIAIIPCTDCGPPN